MRLIQAALRFFARLLGFQCALSQAGDLFVQRFFLLLQGFDFIAQGLDLAFAQQRALLGRTRAQHAHPTGAETLARTCDDRSAIAQLRQQGARVT